MINYSQKRLTLKLIGCFFFIFLIFLQGCEKEQVAEKKVVRPIKAMMVTDAVQFRQRQFPGTAKATQEIDLSFRVSGPLITLPVNIGDEVSIGDVVARIDPRDYEVRLRSSRGELNDAMAIMKRATADYQRVKNIFETDPGAVSQVAVDNALQVRDSGRAKVDALRASVATAKDQLSYSYLKAPFDGIVVNKYVENFEDVRPKQAVVRIVDDSHIEMIISIPESLISLVPRARNIEVIFDAFPDRKIPAEIKEIGKEASKTTRTYPVTLIMEQPDDITILPGMAGRATGEASEDAGLLPEGKPVPVNAIFSPDDIDKTYVWIIDEKSNQVTKHEVTTGRLTNTGIMVTDGLDTGVWIAIAGVHYLREGMEVRILEEKAE
ncbi:MAG: efflux RND transporter periplasmic adaptor subunit [Gammaproteobacteria bacterium]